MMIVYWGRIKNYIILSKAVYEHLVYLKVIPTISGIRIFHQIFNDQQILKRKIVSINITNMTIFSSIDLVTSTKS